MDAALSACGSANDALAGVAAGSPARDDGVVLGVVRAAVVVTVLLAVLVGLLWAFQRRLVYLPDDGPVPAAADAVPGGRDVQLTTADGLTLGAWFVPGPTTDAPAVLVANGNGGHRGLRAPLARALSAAGLGVLLFDYRGYGGNPGSPARRASPSTSELRAATSSRRPVYPKGGSSTTARAWAAPSSPSWPPSTHQPDWCCGPRSSTWPP